MMFILILRGAKERERFDLVFEFKEKLLDLDFLTRN